MGSGKKKIEIKKIEKESRRMVTFSKRRKGLFKKTGEFCSKNGAKIAIIVMSASGKPYPYGDIKAAVGIHAADALNSDSNLQSSSVINDSDDEDGEIGNSDETQMMIINEMLNEEVEDCVDLEKLMKLHQKFMAAKNGMLRAETHSWILL